MEQVKTIPRPEYPRPQLIREGFLNLNGEWEFDYDYGVSKKERRYWENGAFPLTVTVPFCPESDLSGIGCKDFMNAVWYRRTVTLSPEQVKGRTLLHFGAVDYEAEVWVNGQSAGTHAGGYASFTLEVTRLVHSGENTIVVYTRDDNRSGAQPSGKQSTRYESYGCSYTRTTGIWQTVWLEFIPDTFIASYKAVPDAANGRVSLSVKLDGYVDGLTLRAVSSFEGKETGEACARVESGHVCLSLSLSETHLWDIAQPNLYDLRLSLERDGGIVDDVRGYFGLRTVAVKGRKFYLNGRSIYQRLVLDQGFYPDGIYTAPSDEALRRDIELSMALGFNGARLHQKAFEERFLYWADHLGYLVWGEHANWELDITSARALESFLPEWLEIVARDFNHPSIIGWCPFNETWDRAGHPQDDEVLRTVYLCTKACDPTRPVIDTSGNFHVVTDIYDVHTYEQDVDTFRRLFAETAKGETVYENYPDRQKWEGQPYFVSEFGGTWWDTSEHAEEGWGYGERPQGVDEVQARCIGLTKVLMENPYVIGSCYTQLYDVEQERNGLYTYDRKPKFPESFYDVLRAQHAQKAAIEAK